MRRNACSTERATGADPREHADKRDNIVVASERYRRKCILTKSNTGHCDSLAAASCAVRANVMPTARHYDS